MKKVSVENRDFLYQLKKGEKQAWRILFEEHYTALCHVALRYVDDVFTAESIVSDVMLKFWECRQHIIIRQTLRSYLVSAVRNTALNFLNSQYIRKEDVGGEDDILSSTVAVSILSDDVPIDKLIEEELEDKVMATIDEMPKECQRVFKMSKYEGKSNDNIAEELGISVVTVRYHLRNAIKILREAITPYLKIAITMIITTFFQNN
uniref:RNA polymerase sigma-70 factor n=1 Tax=Prevotella sp. TaxID=59823 RepID=UPI004027559C